MKSWLREELFSSLSKNCRRKRKEVLRFHEAQVHAVLAVTRLAAAIAGMVANSNIETSYISSNRSCLSKQREGAVNETNTVVASAAALVATVCAEAAEAIGAKRNQVTSAIKMGLESWSSCDMLTLTATAATCKCINFFRLNNRNQCFSAMKEKEKKACDVNCDEISLIFFNSFCFYK